MNLPGTLLMKIKARAGENVLLVEFRDVAAYQQGNGSGTPPGSPRKHNRQQATEPSQASKQD
jgi:hypothetical protein